MYYTIITYNKEPPKKCAQQADMTGAGLEMANLDDVILEGAPCPHSGAPSGCPEGLGFRERNPTDSSGTDTCVITCWLPKGQGQQHGNMDSFGHET